MEEEIPLNPFDSNQRMQLVMETTPFPRGRAVIVFASAATRA